MGERVLSSAAGLGWVVALLSCPVLLACGGRADTNSAGTASEPNAAHFPIPELDSDDPCLTPDERADVVKVRSANGAELAGVLLGVGRRGVVLVPAADHSLCDWIEYARSLADRGFAVFTFDLNGSGLSQASDDVGTTPRYDADVLAAVQTLRGQGVESVALAGASIGATAAIVAAAELGDDVTRVAELSGDAVTWDGMSALDAVPRLGVPLLCIAGAQDFGPANDAQRLCDAATSAPSHEVLIAPNTMAHGTQLLEPANPTAAEIQARLDEFLTR